MNTSVPAQGTDIAARQRLARISIEQPAGLFGKIIGWYSRRTYGQALDNGYVMAHNKPVLFGVAMFEQRVGKWKKLDPNLKAMAVMAVAVQIGCTWCVDFGYYLAHSEGQDVSKLQDVPNWRDSDLFSPLERLVLDYAESMSALPMGVTDELVAALRVELSDAALVELTMIIAVENQRSRFNSALGLVAQGFSDSCQGRQ